MSPARLESSKSEAYEEREARQQRQDNAAVHKAFIHTSFFFFLIVVLGYIVAFAKVLTIYHKFTPPSFFFIFSLPTHIVL
jgi:uncharacterized membrane protein YozB (DUF420 family)